LLEISQQVFDENHHMSLVNYLGKTTQVQRNLLMKFITSLVWKKTTELCDDLQKSSQVLPPVL